MEVKVERIKMLEDKRGRFSPIFVCPGWWMNEAWSHTGVFRGLHVQKPEQRKIVRCVRGKILDIWVDPNGVVGGLETGGSAGELIDIPRGFLHGYVTLEPSLVQYFVDTEWNPSGEEVYDVRSPNFDWSQVSPEFYDRVMNLRSHAVISERDNYALEWNKR